jgi:uncharacterized protein (DUF2252 family)
MLMDASSRAFSPDEEPGGDLPRTEADCLSMLVVGQWGTRAERVARGKGARRRAPRSSHAFYEPAADRPDPVDLLEQQAADRVPELIPIRYGRMLASPFAFYRGGAAIMSSDLAATPVSGFTAQLCGDAHLMNFGFFSSADRRLVFDINDFDETLPGPWEWDLKRLAVSFEVAGRARGFDAATRRAIVMGCVRDYREAITRMAEMRILDVWYLRLDSELIRSESAALNKKAVRRIDRDLSSAGRRDSIRALSRLSRVVDGKPRFVSAPPLLVPVDALLTGEALERSQDAIEAALESYRSSLSQERQVLYDFYRYQDMARKVVGVGSVGTRAWVLLFLGRDAEDPLVLQSKQAGASVLERFVGRSQYVNAGQRVVVGQRLMQATGDILLGWYRVVGFDGVEHDFYMRQLWDGKGSFTVEKLDQSAWPGYAKLCSGVLARGHARSGDRLAIAAYVGSGEALDRAIADFAEAYAEQNQRDYDALRVAADSGRVSAEAGV